MYRTTRLGVRVIQQEIRFHLSPQIKYDKRPGAENDVRQKEKAIHEIRAQCCGGDHLQQTDDVELQVILARTSVEEFVKAQENDKINRRQDDALTQNEVRYGFDENE